jgi:hypothetical protein
LATLFAWPFSSRLFLWGYLKSKVYDTRPANLDDLKTRIHEEIENIPVEMLQWIMRRFTTRLWQCVQSDGAHLTDVVFKK